MAVDKELQFAYRFPFTAQARVLVEKEGLSLERVPEQVLARARARVEAAQLPEPYDPLGEKSQYAPTMLEEVLAFPVAKVLASLTQQGSIMKRLARNVEKTTHHHLEHAQGRARQHLIEALAEELEVELEPAEHGFHVPLLTYLRPELRTPEFKLVNRGVEKGKVALSEEDTARFLSRCAAQRVAETLPVKLDKPPKALAEEAAALGKQIIEHEAKEFTHLAPGAPLGAVAPQYFPPCMKSLYKRLLGGENLPHQARFDLACFLVAARMPLPRIVDAFSKASNYNEKTTRYHLKNVIKKEYSPPSCNTLRAHGLACEDCTFNHPLTRYRQRKEEAGKAGSDKEAEKAAQTAKKAQALKPSQTSF